MRGIWDVEWRERMRDEQERVGHAAVHFLYGVGESSLIISQESKFN